MQFTLHMAELVPGPKGQSFDVYNQPIKELRQDVLKNVISMTNHPLDPAKRHRKEHRKMQPWCSMSHSHFSCKVFERLTLN